MKNLLRFGILMLLGMAVFLLSCSDDDGPTAPDTPNFENFSPYMWDYNSVLWFDMDYQETKSGIASIYVSLSAKGANPSATLMVNNIPVVFANESSFSEGRIYDMGAYATGPIQISTTQPVTYEIVYKEDAAAPGNGATYTGTMALPDEVTGNFPSFVATNNFAPNWVMGTGNTAPDFILVSAEAAKVDDDDHWTSLNYVRQKAGTETNDVLLASFWESLLPLNLFSYDINPVVYEMKENYKLLTVGISNDSYQWMEIGKKAAPAPRSKFRQVMEAIHADLNK